MSNSLDCPGLRAPSVLAWLAAVGATVLDKRLRLHWATDATPFAVLSSDDLDPLDALLDAWPDSALLNDMPIARKWRQTEPMGRHVQVELFRKRAKLGRGHSHSWTLSSTITDLQVSKDGMVEHGPFDPSVPKGLTLHDRLLKLHKQEKGDGTWSPSAAQLRDSMLGQATRVQDNGLGFDHARIGSLADETKRWTDPAIETLAFFGLALLPVRGDGIDEQLGRQSGKDRHRQRGWRPFDDNGATIRHFAWPTWRQPLDSAGIDALLDTWRPDRLDRKAGWKLLGIHAGWRSVAYKAQSSSDATKAYGSKRL